MKSCIEAGCDRPQFGGGFCKYHQYKRKMQGGDQHKRKAPAKRTPKRAKDERHYKDKAREFFEEKKANKENYCFFCGKEVKTFEGLHHLKGRTGDYLLDREWWVVVHNDCHVWDYHQANYEQRTEQEWWQGFLDRLKAKDEGLYRKEIKKGEKVNKLNPRINFDEEDDFS